MSDDGLNLSRRKVLGGITTVGAASAAAGAGTFALFSDTSSTNEATISTGTVSFQDGNPTTLDISATDQGSTGGISGSTKFTYTGSLDATFVIGMEINDVDGDENALAEQIELNTAKLTHTDPEAASDGSDITTVDTLSSGADGGTYILNELNVDKNPPTLSDLSAELSGDETITVEDENGNTNEVPALKWYSPIQTDDSVTLTIDGEWNDLGNEFQDQEIGVTVYGKVVETSSN